MPEETGHDSLQMFQLYFPQWEFLVLTQEILLQLQQNTSVGPFFKYMFFITISDQSLLPEIHLLSLELPKLLPCLIFQNNVIWNIRGDVSPGFIKDKLDRSLLGKDPFMFSFSTDSV